MKTIFAFFNSSLLFVALPVCLTLSLSITSYGQSITAIAEFSDAARDSNALSGMIYLSNVDSSNTSQIEVKIGTETNDTAAVHQLFDFDIFSGLPAGFSFYRDKNNISLGVFSEMAIWTYYCHIRLKDNAGNWTSFNFITN